MKNVGDSVHYTQVFDVVEPYVFRTLFQKLYLIILYSIYILTGITGNETINLRYGLEVKDIVVFV